MSEFQGTPGEWSVAGPSGFAVKAASVDGTYLVGVAHHGAQRAPIGCGVIPMEEALKNALLFAAAKQQHEALKQAQAALALIVRPTQKVSGLEIATAHAVCVAAETVARLALAKALGEDQ